MNIQHFLFKISVMILQTLKITAIFTPLVMAVRALRGVEFVWQDETAAGIFIAFGIGMSLTVWNALDFENYKKIELKQYLKTNQSMPIQIQDGVQMADVFNFIVKKAETNKDWKLVDKSEARLKIQTTSPYKFKDIVVIENQGNNKLFITSRPKSFFWLIDLGRNYKNILGVLRVIKEMPL